MAKDQEVLLTIQQVEEWEKEAAALAKKIADDQEHLHQLRQKLKSAALFMPPKVPKVVPMVLFSPPPPREPAVVQGSHNLTEAVERIANKDGPVSKKSLKEMLAKEGFHEDRLANYFYTTIHRLKASNRITVHENGSVGPAT